MVRVPGGTFEMGDVMGDNEFDREKPVHTVTLSPYEIGRYEVTFAQYDVFCEATGRDKPDDEGWGRGNRPVIYVSWYDAVAYCNWLSEQQGYEPVYELDGREVANVDWEANGYRLPTEAEWEYAARGGGKKVRFGNGKDTARASEINFDASENYKKPYSEVGKYRGQTVPVGSLNSPNGLGLHNMSGNVYEWCWDWYSGDYYASSPERNPRGPDSGSNRVVRGGSWNVNPQICRAANRNGGNPSIRGNYLGFRVARSSRR
jgi:formylglycine-generating enzyme required for sulfatase activity